MTPLTVVRLPALRRILSAYAVSKIGDQLYATALLVVVLQLTGSATWVALAVTATFLPYAVVAPFAGVLADRTDRQRLMVVTDVIRTGLMLAAVPAVTLEQPAVLVLLAFVATSVGTPFTSAVNALLPELLEEDALPAANAAVQGVASAGLLIGPSVAATVLAADLLWLPFLLNAASFVVSAVLVIGVRRPAAGGVAEGVAAELAGDPEESFGAAVLTGARAVFGSRFLVLVLLIAVPALAAYGLEQVVMPLVSRDQLGTGEAGLGWLVAAVGLGGVLGTWPAARLARSEQLLPAFAVAAIGTTLPLGLLGVIGSPWLAYLVLTVEGAAAVALETVLITALQRTLPGDQVARVDALLTAVGVVATVGGTFAAPLLVEQIGLTATLGWTTAVCVGLATLAALYGAATDAGRQVAGLDAELLELLRAVPALRGLDEAGVQALAGATGPVRELAVDDRLLVAGEVADEVLVLVEGRCDVLAGETLVNQVQGPDLLGEIGVLNARPRTATVVAAGPVCVRSIPAEAFARVVAPGTAVPAALRASVNTRLSRWPG